MDLID